MCVHRPNIQKVFMRPPRPIGLDPSGRRSGNQMFRLACGQTTFAVMIGTYRRPTRLRNAQRWKRRSRNGSKQSACLAPGMRSST